MYKIAVLGDRDSVLGFKALGLDAFFSDSPEELKTELHRLARSNYAVIYITEDYAKALSDEIEKYKDSVTPAIILIPGKSGSLGLGASSLKLSVERAVGADIISGSRD